MPTEGKWFFIDNDISWQIATTEKGKTVKLGQVISEEIGCRIVQCVNPHDELVDALKYTYTLLTKGIGQNTHAIAIIEQALANAQKEGE